PGARCRDRRRRSGPDRPSPRAGSWGRRAGSTARGPWPSSYFPASFSGRSLRAGIPGSLPLAPPPQSGDERREGARGDRRAPQEALTDRAAELVERDPLLDRLHPLGHDRETEAAAERDDGLGDRAVVLIAWESGDERSVDLE